MSQMKWSIISRVKEIWPDDHRFPRHHEETPNELQQRCLRQSRQ